jgi:protein-S-isoprenylcysteine O-methyltransferase Ste14
MSTRGLDALRAHVPGLGSRWGLLRVALAILLVLVLTSLFLLAADTWFSEWMPDGEIVILALGFLLLSRFFTQRERYQRRFGEAAYRIAFSRFNIPGLGMIGAAIGHLAYIAGPGIPPLWWRSWLIALGYALVAIGIVLCARAISTLGLDHLTMLYVYYPEEAHPTSSGIYGLVRHPVYSGALHIGFGLALIHASWYALLVALLLPIFFLGWVRLVEEPNLVTRYPSYEQYRRRVPPFWPRPTAWLTFTRFLFVGER